MKHQPALAPSPIVTGTRRSCVADVITALSTGVAFDDLPAAAIEAAKRSILDTLAVAVAGTRSRAGRSAIDAFAARGGGGSATVMGTPFKAHPSIAALVNGTMAHALDFDDVWADDDGVIAWRGHPSVCVLPAVLAAGEAEGCDGATALLAYVIGVEIAGKLGTAFGPHLGRAGFHPTPILGTLATAAAVARVLNVERARANVMLGLAATEASGLCRNFGTDTKPFHAGHAAQCGLQATLLACEGFTANPEAVTDYLKVHGGPDESDAVAVLETLGKVYDIVAPGLSIKKYPCCRFIHLPLDATFMLLERERFAASDLETFTIRIQPGADDALIYKEPRTGLEGKFSMEYALAAAILDGRATLSSFADEMVLRPEVRALMKRIRTEYKPEPGAEVLARTPHGEYRALATVVRGDPANPLSRDELLQKCYQCLEGILAKERIDRLVDTVERLEQLPDVRQLTDLLHAENL
ncbi:MAG: MmgE/PrpD family protein [Betaproteobacteria bacterium]|nr:MmgE/PrpD family protein [Betaproteobacteria bacterium]